MTRREHGLLQGHPPPSPTTLLAWIRRAKGHVHPHVTIAPSGDGWGLKCAEPIALGDVLFSLPKTAVLSVRTSSLPPLPSPTSAVGVKTSFTILHLALAVLHEFRLAADSPYYGYLQSLPRETVLIPLLWSVPSLGGEDGAKALAWLQGTQAERDMKWRAKEGLSLTDITAFYTATCRLLPPTRVHPDLSPIEAFYHAYSLVSSRAFLIDLHHTVALCPFADVLNHSSSPHTSLASDEFVCHICGSLCECPHDFFNTSGIPRRLEHLPPHVRTKLAVEEDTVEMRLEAPAEVAEEIFNTYGEDIGDSKLLVEWGFIGNEYAGEGLIWDLEDILPDPEKRHAYENLRETGTLKAAFASVFQDGDEDDDQELVTASARLGSLSLSQMGLLSIDLFGAICFSLPDFQASQSPTDTVRAVMNVLQEMTGRTKVGFPAGNHPRPGCLDLAQIAEAVVHLLEERQRAFYKNDVTVDELFDELELFPDNAKLQRMAMALRINEQSLLSSSRHKWINLLANEK